MAVIERRGARARAGQRASEDHLASGPPNAIESVNSAIRKFTRNRKQYPNAESALKLVYLAIHEASKRWTMPIRGWKAALNHFAIMFEDRLPGRGKKEAA